MPKKAKPVSATRTERFQMRATPAFMQAVEDWRAEQRPIPSLTEAICRLVEAALEAEKKRGRK